MNDKPAKRPSPLKRLARWGILMLLVVAAAVYFWQWHRAQSAWEAEIEKIQNRGEPVRIADLAVELENPDDDAGPLLLEAINLLQEPDQAYLRFMTAESPTRGRAHTALRDELLANQKSLELAKQAVAKPHCRLLVTESLHDERRADILKCRALSDLLRAQVLWSLRTGEQQAAFSSMIQGFQLARLAGEESLTVSRFTAIAVQNAGLDSLAEFLSQGRLAPEEFSTIDEQLVYAEQDCRCQSTLNAIRAGLIDETAIPLVRASIGVPGAPAWVASLKRTLYEPLAIDNAVYWIHMLSELAVISDLPGLDNPQVIDWRHRVEQSPYALVKPYLVAAPHLRGPILAMRQKLILARWALRVDRHFRQNGQFPTSLSQVGDAELSVVRPDLVFNKPLVFETYERGFVIRIEVEDRPGQEFLKNCRFEVTYPATVDLQDAPDVSTQD